MGEQAGRRATTVAAVLIVGAIAASAALVVARVGSAPDIVLTGIISSEKEGWLGDERTAAVLAEHDMDLQLEQAGSRDMAVQMDLSRFDFAFPAGAPSAERIRQDHEVTAIVQPFHTPMAIATWEPIVGLLVAAGVATRGPTAATLDLAAFMQLAAGGRRWSDLPGNTVYPEDRPLLITSTDVRTSNSAAMYLSLTSYVANGGRVVDDAAAMERVLPVVTPLFLRQGLLEYSSQAPFDNYLIQGMVGGIGRWPLVLVYEAQFVERAAHGRDAIRPGMVLMYPSPTILSRPTLVGLTEDGRRMGDLLLTEPRLGELAVGYGYRTDDPEAFGRYTAEHGLQVPLTLENVIEPPSFAILEAMIRELEAAYGRPGSTDAPD